MKWQWSTNLKKNLNIDAKWKDNPHSTSGITKIIWLQNVCFNVRESGIPLCHWHSLPSVEMLGLSGLYSSMILRKQ